MALGRWQVSESLKEREVETMAYVGKKPKPKTKPWAQLKFKKGQTVFYDRLAAATSCCMNGLHIKGCGTITGKEYANGCTMYVIDHDTLLFEREVKRVVK